MLYAAYGSNLDSQQMSHRCPHSPLRQTGWLNDWRLTFGGDGWDGALPTLVETRSAAADPATPGGEGDPQVFVALYDVTDGDERALDEWESAPSGLYRKVKLRASVMEGEVAAWAYVLDDFEGRMPSARTLGLLADAAETAGAPADYVHALRSRPCVSGW